MHGAARNEATFTRIAARISQLQLKARNADTMHQVNTSLHALLAFFIAAKSSVQSQEVIHTKSLKKSVRMIHLKLNCLLLRTLIMYRIPFLKTPVGLKLGSLCDPCLSKCLSKPRLCHGPGDRNMPRRSRNAVLSCSFHSCTSTTTHLSPESDLDFRPFRIKGRFDYQGICANILMIIRL